jgi:hypothetical protein
MTWFPPLYRVKDANPKTFFPHQCPIEYHGFHPLPKFQFGKFCWWQRSMDLWEIIMLPSSLLFVNCFFFYNTNKCDLRTRPQNTDCCSSFPSLKVLSMIRKPFVLCGMKHFQNYTNTLYPIKPYQRAHNGIMGYQMLHKG